MMTNQDVVVSEMGIGAGSALPGPSPALLACRGAAAGAMSLRYLDLAAAAARSASCSWVDAMRASSPTRSRAAAAADVDELTAWMVSELVFDLDTRRELARGWCMATASLVAARCRSGS